MQLDRRRSRRRASAGKPCPRSPSISPLGGPRPGASVLAVPAVRAAPPRALVAVQRYGAGRSMVFTGEASWRWRMMLPAGDRSYDTFWRQAARWLALHRRRSGHADAPAVRHRPATAIRWRVSARDADFEPLRRRRGRRSRDRDRTAGSRSVRPPRRTRRRGDGCSWRHRGRTSAGVYRATAEVAGRPARRRSPRRRCWSAAPTAR